MIDPTPYQELIPRAVNRLGFPQHQRDEAYSEGLVVLVVAAKAFDPDRGVPPEAYLSMRLRWDLTSWRRRQHEETCLGDLDVPHEAHIVDQIHLREVLEVCKKMPAAERIALLGSAMGYKQVELCHWLRQNSVGLKRLKTAARQRLTETLGVV